MRKKLLYNLLVVLAATMFNVGAAAQNNFRYSSALGKVDKGAFYKILLTPEIVGRSQPRLIDMRIRDDKGSQVPYIVKSDIPVFNEKSFIGFPLISNKKEADKQTHVVIENSTSKNINYLLLLVKNTEANRLVTISGSDDKKRWFVIKENIYLDNNFSDYGSFVQTISFPPSNYQYFKVTIIGQNVLPVNIIKAGIYKENFIDGKYTQLPAPIINQIDSANKYSYIKFAFNEPYQLDKIELDIAGPKFYNRSAEVFSVGGSKILNVFEINSAVSASFSVRVHADTIVMVIYNEDSPPLKVMGAKGWQLNHYLLAYLEKGKEYTLHFGDSNASAPKYDLEFFKDSIGQNPVEINVGKIETAAKTVEAVKSNSVFNNAILWIVISIVLFTLLLLTFRMTKEVDRRSKNRPD